MGGLCLRAASLALNKYTQFKDMPSKELSEKNQQVWDTIFPGFVHAGLDIPPQKGWI